MLAFHVVRAFEIVNTRYRTYPSLLYGFLGECQKISRASLCGDELAWSENSRGHLLGNDFGHVTTRWRVWTVATGEL
jgi:hypothetical protein